MYNIDQDFEMFNLINQLFDQEKKKYSKNIAKIEKQDLSKLTEVQLMQLKYKEFFHTPCAENEDDSCKSHEFLDESSDERKSDAIKRHVHDCHHHLKPTINEEFQENLNY